MEDDDLILLAGIGTFLVTYSGARGAVEVADTVIDTVTDAAGEIKSIANNPVAKVLDLIGVGL